MTILELEAANFDMLVMQEKSNPPVQEPDPYK
jgi:hypothetical protein